MTKSRTEPVLEGRTKRDVLYAAYAAAAKDAEFRKSMDEVADDFTVADTDGLFLLSPMTDSTDHSTW